MKNVQSSTMQLQTVKFFALLLICCATLLTLDSCKKDATTDATTDDLNLTTTTTAATTADDREILDRLTDAGFAAADLEFKDDFVVYQGDAGWDKTALLSTLRQANTGHTLTSFGKLQHSPEALTDDRQQGISETATNEAVTATTAKVLKYFVRPSVASDCGTPWVTAISSGMTKWNGATYCRIKLTKVTTQATADIVFGSDLDTLMPLSHQNLPATTIALAGFPSAGTPWKWISINDNNDNLASASKIQAMMHEFGHCVGYRHTGTLNGTHIHGTPDSESTSIMNPVVSTFNVFSTGDLRGMRMYYPDALVKATLLTAVKFDNTTIKVTYKNPQMINKPYFWVRSKLFNASGGLINSGFLTANADPDGTDVFYWINLTPGSTYKVSVLGENFRHDVAGPETAAVTVTL